MIPKLYWKNWDKIGYIKLQTMALMDCPEYIVAIAAKSYKFVYALLLDNVFWNLFKLICLRGGGTMGDEEKIFEI